MRVLLEYSDCLLDVLKVRLRRLVFRLQDLLWGLSTLRLGLGLDVSQELGVPSEHLIVQVLNKLVVPHQIEVQDDLLIEPPVEEVEVLPAPWVFLFSQQRAINQLLQSAEQIPSRHFAEFLHKRSSL